MFAVLTCLHEQHDLRLVIVAAVICIIASATAFGFHKRSLAVHGGFRFAWLSLTGLVAGSGVWATHFIAMLAYQPSLQIGYDLPITAASLTVAVIGMGAGFALPVWRPGPARALTGGALTGGSVAVMHYMGIAAIRTQAYVTWDQRYVIASILIGVIGGMAAFFSRDRARGRLAWAAPTGLLVLAIVGLHFTAMTAVNLLPDSEMAVPAGVMDRMALAAATGGLATMILAAAFSLTWMERMSHHSSLSGLRDALDAMPPGLAFFGPTDQLMTWNRSCAAMLSSCGATAVRGLPRRAVVVAIFGAAGDDQKTLVADARLPDGRWIRYESSATRNGGSVVALTDVSAQKQAADAMAAALDSAEAANRAKSTFLANMSHEIRTPLNGVLGVADLLMRSGLGEPQQDLVRAIQESGTLLNGLLTDLLDLARVEAGMAELRPVDVDLRDLVRSVGVLFQGAASKKGLTLKVDIRDDSPADAQVSCDPMRLRQVLGNLVSNAVKFTETGEVALVVERFGREIRFQVRDTGAGFDDALKALIFQRFRQGDSSATRKQGGAGLGLAICDEYVRLMGGELDCESALGVGSTFGFSLDLPARAAVGPPTASDLGRVDAAGFRVLVVDDNATNRQLLELILDSAGIEHVSVENGALAVEAVAQRDFGAVLMDLQMPVMDGLEATRRIRAWECSTRRPPAPILIVSANCLQQHVEAGRAAGANLHLNKPISVTELLGALQSYIPARRDAA
jgi:signal transduction histidine kinase/ActR/RegA family two-component response regulator